MSKNNVRIACWEKSHITDLVMNLTEVTKLQKLIPLLKRVCPHCRPENKEIVVISGRTLYDPPKAYTCEKGHLTLISTLGDMLQVAYAKDKFINIKADLSILSNMIDKSEIVCHNDGCGCKLTALDDYSLVYPQSPGIKTKTRVGDVWDRNGIQPVRPGHYDRDGSYTSTSTEKAQKERLKKMRRPRNVGIVRLPGNPK